MTEHVPRILLVEDQPFHYRPIIRRLEGLHYSVEHARDYASARILLEEGTFHLAILDICLNQTAGKNEDGLELLEDIKRLGLHDVMPAIVLTGFSTEDRVLRAKEDLDADRYIRKESGYLAKLESAVQELFEHQIGINFALRYEGDSLARLGGCAKDIYAGEKELPSQQVLEPQIRDLMSKLFPRAVSLMVRREAQGLSGSAVVYAHPRSENGLEQSFIVKIGRGDKTAKEEGNYHEFVEGYLPSQHETQLRTVYTRHLGAIVYTLNTETSHDQDFADFYRRYPASKVNAALKNLFHKTCQAWYENRQGREYLDLRRIYLEAFNLDQQPDRLPNEIATLRPGLERGACMLPFPALHLELPNPICWLDESESGLLPVHTCITHGDLHAGNILIDEAGKCWLIDFLRTHRSHILRDLVKLEVDIKFNLLSPLVPADYMAFERTLLQLTPGKRTRSVTGMSPAVAKATQVIAALRAEAWRLLDAENADKRRRQEIQYEHLFSLLMTTLNVLRLRHYKERRELAPYRELALLSSCLLCEKLAELKEN